MKKHAVVTINIGKRYSKMASLTLPTHKAYAKKIGAEFVEIKEFDLPFIESEYSAYWAKFKLFELLSEYERIIFLDLDTVVQKNCPNLFDIVEVEQFAVLYETDFGIDQTIEINDMIQKMPQIKWGTEYFNVGVMVMSSCHKPIFEFNEESQGGLKYPEQTLLNYNVNKLGCEVFHLPIQFNHMLFLNVDPSERIDSYIIHYAGLASEVKDILIEDDLEKFKSGGTLITEASLGELIVKKLPNVNPNSEAIYGRLYKDDEIGLSV
ncbi:glycosyltransferase [Pseudoalteromonas holothuriae]|uniref:glycosyltransferase n=1 Tax=Pseudoalteromonas holothuriae TaxID=2963714 RepID=UPI0021C1A252|nr:MULTISPECIES: glycosyltransferase [unclassified Pseudoalteromonas]